MTAREYIYRMLETYHVSNSDFRMVNAGEKAVEAAMIEFAKERIKEAQEAALQAIDDNMIPNCSDHTPYWGACVSCGRYDNPIVMPDESVIIALISDSYPIENIK